MERECRLVAAVVWHPVRAGAVVAVAAPAFYMRENVAACGGSDSYGYVAEAALLARGHWLAPAPLAAILPQVGAAVAPLRFKLVGGHRLAPTSPPGLPTLMALVQIAGGPAAVFLVAPFAAALALWTIVLLGAAIGRPGAGLVAKSLFGRTLFGRPIDEGQLPLKGDVAVYALMPRPTADRRAPLPHSTGFVPPRTPRRR